MQPSYALLPATSYPKTVGGMCYAENTQANTDRVKTKCDHYLSRQAILACNHPIIDQGS